MYRIVCRSPSTIQKGTIIMKSFLIIDIETYLYKSITYAQCLIQDKINKKIFVQGYDISKAEKYIQDTIDTLCKELNADGYELVAGDKENFRKKLYPQYKAQRQSKPDIYPHIYEAIKSKHGMTTLTNLEGDDTCRIIYEDSNYQGDKQKIIVSIDKDFYSVPCVYYRDLPNYRTVEVIGKEQARLNLIKQIIMGDKADNYHGIPGIGEKKVEQLVTKDMTGADVLQLFRDNKLTGEDYLMNKVCASIVNMEQYNSLTGEIDFTKGDI